MFNRENHSSSKTVLTSALIVIGFAALPLATAAPAEATKHINGCTVTALTPTKYQQQTRVQYKIELLCSANRTVAIHQRYYEKDTPQSRFDDLLGDRQWTEKFSTTKTMYPYTATWAPNTERGDEEVYHKVRISVKVGNGAWSKWTDFDFSALRTINQP
jgi:hypothetical protein